MKFNIVVLYNPVSHNLNFYKDLKNLLSVVDNGCECTLFRDFNINWMDRSGEMKLKTAAAD